MVRKLARATAMACSLWLLLAVPLWPAAGDEPFKLAMAALDRERWSDAADHLRQAINLDSRESDRRIFISGVFSRPYLPHFYLGWALLQQGQQNCQQVVASWQTSRDQGVIQRFSRQLQDLEVGSSTCFGILLPPALSRTSAVLDEATTLAGSLPTEVAEEQLRADLESARNRLTQARQRFADGRGASQLSEIGAAEQDAATVLAALKSIATQLESVADRQLEDQAQDTAATVTLAEQARSSLQALLTHPQNAEALREYPQLQTPADAELKIASAKRRLERRADLTELAQAKSDARSAADGFAAVEARARQVIATWRQQRRGQPNLPTATPSSSPPSLPPAQSAARSPAQSAAQLTTQPPTQSPADDSLSAIRRLANVAQALLQQTSELTDSGDLLAVQQARLSTLVRDSRDVSATSAPRLRRRLEESITALRVLAAAGELFAGRPASARQLLVNVEQLLANADQPFGRIAAQAFLLRAAASFANWQAQPKPAPQPPSDVAADLARCRTLDADLEPDSRAFSPPFRRFFASLTDGGQR